MSLFNEVQMSTENTRVECIGTVAPSGPEKSRRLIHCTANR